MANDPGAAGDPRTTDQPLAAGSSSAAIDPALPYETARDELRDIVRTLEQGDLTLEESLRLWERGEDLALHCEAKLRGAQQRLEAVTAADNTEAESASQG